MSKIWEIDFTSFSGSSALDNIGNQDLTVTSGSVKTVKPLSQFNFRSGVEFNVNSSMEAYNLTAASATNTFISHSYGVSNQRSFVMWFLRNGTPAVSGTLWANADSPYTSTKNGIAWGANPSGIEVIIEDDIIYTSPTISANTWYLSTLVVDRSSNKVEFYLNKDKVAYSGVLPSSGQADLEVIGELSSSLEGEYQLAYTSTYDHALSSTEVGLIYDSYLEDTYNPYYFKQVIGAVYDDEGSALSGANVLLYDHYELEVVDQAVSEAGGLYKLHAPKAGNFSIYSTKSGTSGGAACSITITSSGSVIYYD